ncbi:radical SAM protein [Solwaraspora sp. WMMD791]|uniref:B12-binding domain-containing radical SAM protein n=1 Tax=Solwaraspora sp. WMMD791 TaxID=3016086 RepID=UPI00249BE93C|nr:radical SAM protein [Solwaraspora sp. WMMD791]WFE29027.1 radical SAM protein [Solwaraspora sp. WMMD791]
MTAGVRAVVAHPGFAGPPPVDRDAATRRLAQLHRQRAAALAADCPGDDIRSQWRARAFPVLAALAPVMTSTEGEITYPGDPMCLYAALSVTVDAALQSAAAAPEHRAAFPGLCPDWGVAPSKAYRLAAQHGPRGWHTADSNSDRSVFDPRVWDAPAREQLRDDVRRRRPRVFLVSTVSPGHRYALQMAELVKREVPDCLVVFGGRHIDETMRYRPDGTLALEYSATLRAIDEGRARPVVDFLISGDGYFSLHLLMQAIALSMDIRTRATDVDEVVATLDLLAAAGEQVPGTSLLCARTADAVHAFPIKGAAYDLADLPMPYQGFAIRARFPVFPRPDGTPARTAHMTVSNACPYHCDFCSEAAPLAGGLRRFRTEPVAAALERICACVSYGAEAVFFDDSIFWSGNFPLIRAFCTELAALRVASTPAELPPRYRKWIEDEGDWQRLRQLRFGGQVTVDLLTTLHKETDVVDTLRLLKQAGCGYLYLGIESMSEQVMVNIHKNLRRSAQFPWPQKVRTALERIRDAGIPVGSSVLFGLEGEDRTSIEETIDGVGELIDAGLLMLASPNILTYHPATPITRQHQMADSLDYHSPTVDNRPPYIYFEEAFPGVVSRRLTEDDIWYIHEATQRRWGTRRNSAPAEPAADPH